MGLCMKYNRIYKRRKGLKDVGELLTFSFVSLSVLMIKTNYVLMVISIMIKKFEIRIRCILSLVEIFI